MEKLKQYKFLIAILIISILGITAYFFYLTTEKVLRERFEKFSNMIEVGLCREAYDGFITVNSKTRKGYDNFLAHCNYRKKDWKNINIQTIVFSGQNRADIKYSYDLPVPDLTSKEYKDCISKTTWEYLNIAAKYGISCYDTAPRKLEKKEWVETWLFEDWKWKRDY